MRILFIAPQFPFPPYGGGKIVMYNLIRRLAKKHEIVLVSLAHQTEDYQALAEMQNICQQVYIFPVRKKWSLKFLLMSLLRNVPYKVQRFFNPRMYRFIKKLLKKELFDIIHCQNFYTGQYIPKETTIPKLLYKENFESIIFERYTKTIKNPLLKFLAALETHKIRKYELAICEKFNQILTISPKDQQALSELNPSLPLEVLPGGVDLESHQPLPAEEGFFNILFTGTLSYYPNVDAILWFASEVLPLIKSSLPLALFWVVGNNPTAGIKDLANKDSSIKVTGKVPDILPYMAKASVYVVPLRIGSGIRLKILEAMACNRAVVSTPVGCEGLAVTHNQNILITPEAEEMAEEIISLLREPERRKALAQAGRKLVEDKYDYDLIANELEHFYLELLGNE